MPTSAKHNSLTEALIAFQASLPSIAKGNEASVQSKEGRSYTYRYADLTDVSAVILPALAKQGLAFTAAPTVLAEGAGQFVLAYQLRHESTDEVIAGFYPLPTSNAPPQALGSAITYARRYALCAVTGVAPGGDDDDAGRAQQEVGNVDWAQLATDAKTVAQLKAVYDGATSAGALTPDLDNQIAKLRGALQQQRETLQRAPQDGADLS